MLSTQIQKTKKYVFVLNLLPLLKERGKTQEELSITTGLSTERVSKLIHQRVFQKIVANTAVRLCVVLSNWKCKKDQRKVDVGLDTLFSMKISSRKSR